MIIVGYQSWHDINYLKGIGPIKKNEENYKRFCNNITALII